MEVKKRIFFLQTLNILLCRTSNVKLASTELCYDNSSTDISSTSGTDVTIFKIFLPKNLAKHLAFFIQNKAYLCKKLIVTLVLEKNANFFEENCRKSQKTVIITSTLAKHGRNFMRLKIFSAKNGDFNSLK
jgi:hypothetical protein